MLKWNVHETKLLQHFNLLITYSFLSYTQPSSFCVCSTCSVMCRRGSMKRRTIWHLKNDQLYCCGPGVGGEERPPGEAVEPSPTEHPELQVVTFRQLRRSRGHLRTVIANSLTAWGRDNSKILIYLSTHIVKLPGKSHPQWTLSNRVTLTTSVRCNRAELPKSVSPNDNLQPNLLTDSQARTMLGQ